jgi:hypothetical protein
MTNAQRRSITTFVIGTVFAAATWGQDYESREEGRKRAEAELIQIGTLLKPGDEVALLRNVQLKAGSETFGDIGKGERVVVEQIQGKWLWVRSEQTRGWIDKEAVLSARMIDWYQRLPEDLSLQHSGRERTKCFGIFLEIVGAGVKRSFLDPGTYRHDNRTYFIADYTNVMVYLENPGTDRGLFYLNFNPPGQLTIPLRGALKGNCYGTVVPGDYVFLSTVSRQVLVNGQLRQATRR